MKKHDRFLRPDEFGDMLQISQNAVEEFVRSGLIRTVRLPSGDLRLDPRSVQEFLLACELDVRKHFVETVP